MKRPSIQTNNYDQIIRNLQYSYPSSPFGDWITFNTNNPHGYFSWDKSIYPDGIRFNNVGSGGWYYSGEWAELSQTVTFEYPQTRTIDIGDMGTTKDNQRIQIWVDGILTWQGYDSSTPTQTDIYFPAGTYEFKIRYYVKEDCYGAPACNLNNVYRIIGYSPPPPPPGNLTINITPSDAIYNVIDSLGSIIISNVPSGTTVSNLTPGTYSSTLSRTGYQDKLLSNIVIGPGEPVILTDILTPLPGSLTINITPSDAIYNVIDSLGNTVVSNVLSGATVSNLIPDTYSSTLTRNGYEDKLLLNIVIGPGESVTLTDTLVPIPTLGDVCIKSNPSGASITIDGTPYPKTTALSGTSCIPDNTITGLAPNSYPYEISLVGYQPKSGNFSITVGTLTQVEAGDLIPIPTTAGGGGFALLSLGLLFGLILSKKKCEDKHTKEECEKTGCQWKDGKCIERK